jgi:antirestriction protein ArdC
MPDRADLYERVTDTIIAQLEAGIVPWVQPWKVGATSRHNVRLPHNAITGRAYSGVNVLLLWCQTAAQGYTSHGWLTYKQAVAAGGHVRKGEQGTLVVYADRFVPKAKTIDDKPRPVYFLKGFTVFNHDQCEGLPAPVEVTPPTDAEQHEAADLLIRQSAAQIVVGGDRAAYWPSRDAITIPTKAAYEPAPINWYRTALHELGHWTGAANRLARDLTGVFGSDKYAREELIAEMTAAFTCAALGIEPTVRHADYIGSWLAVLRNDKKAVVQAASKASKASDYLLAFSEAVEIAA